MQIHLICVPYPTMYDGFELKIILIGKCLCKKPRLLSLKKKYRNDNRFEKNYSVSQLISWSVENYFGRRLKRSNAIGGPFW